MISVMWSCFFFNIFVGHVVIENCSFASKTQSISTNLNRHSYSHEYLYQLGKSRYLSDRTNNQPCVLHTCICLEKHKKHWKH